MQFGSSTFSCFILLSLSHVGHVGAPRPTYSYSTIFSTTFPCLFVENLKYYSNQFKFKKIIIEFWRFYLKVVFCQKLNGVYIFY